MVLVAHGSAYPKAASTTRALARTVAAARPGLDVRVSFLDHGGPRPDEVLFALQHAGYDRAVVVPLLLTAAYHGRVDLPAVLAGARDRGLLVDPVCTDVIGPVGGVVPPLLIDGLRRRLAETGERYGGVVLAAAGTRDAVARRSVDLAAERLGAVLGVPCVPAYASAATPTGGQAVALLRVRGVRRIAVAAYFLACGQLYDMVTGSALSAGAVAAAAPLGAAWELARLVLSRVDTALAGIPMADAVPAVA